jgi:uncharacterized protein YtpQ (UPF0354 family)
MLISEVSRRFRASSFATAAGGQSIVISVPHQNVLISREYQSKTDIDMVGHCLLSEIAATSSRGDFSGHDWL